MTYVDKYMKEVMSKCYLERVSEVSDDCPYESYYLRQPNTGVYRSLIVFTNEGIMVTGDIVFNEHSASGGVTSNHGYGVGWFSSELSEDYLCEKFLRKEWVPDRAIDSLKYMLNEDDEDVSKEQKDSIREAIIDDTCIDANTFYVWWEETFGNSPETIGHGYNPSSAGWLCAVQQRFSELHVLFRYGINNTPVFRAEDLMSDDMLREKLKDCVFYPSTKYQDYSRFALPLEDALKTSSVAQTSDLCLVMKRAMK